MNENSKPPLSEPSTFLRRGSWLFSWRGIRTILLILVWPVTLIALFYGIENWRGSRAWKQYRQELQAKGAVLELSGMVPQQIPADQNFAATPLVKAWFEKGANDNNSKRWNDSFAEASRRVEQVRLKDRQRAVTDLVAWQTAYAAPTNAASDADDKEFSFPDSDAVARASAGKDVLKNLDIFEPVFNELRRASARPESLYPVNYDEPNPWAILLPHLSNLRAVGERLSLRASAELAIGEPGKALDDVRLLLALGDSLRQEPVLVSYLVRVKLLNQAVQPLWEGIRLHHWTGSQLEQFQGLLSKYNLFEGIAPAFQTERAAALVTVDLMRAHQGLEMVGSTAPGEPSDPWTVLLAWVAPRGWFDFEKVNYCRLQELTATRGWDAKSMRVSPTAVDAARDEVAKALDLSSFKRLFEHRITAGLLLPALSKVIQRGATGQTLFNQAVIACALERYRLAKGVYPDNLEALPAAGLIAVMPQDIFSGQPMKYKRIGDQEYVLYSVGWNEQDDGGKSGKTLFDDVGDWVW